ncbi:hypothetical protein VTP01DRAFT_5976 [Rhizomucor pusillus]|uniref:uncharacterized protein n=1 Tax=Rhizomucor pusillus TaxID=4840 RepID=UPI003742E91D
MSGVVIEVRAKPGAHLKTGEPVCVLSVMKMETVVTAPVAGRVEHVPIQEGDSLSSGDLVARIVEPKKGDVAPSFMQVQFRIDRAHEEKKMDIDMDLVRGIEYKHPIITKYIKPALTTFKSASYVARAVQNKGVLKTIRAQASSRLNEDQITSWMCVYSYHVQYYIGLPVLSTGRGDKCPKRHVSYTSHDIAIQKGEASHLVT